jgi:hypothetical protein
MTAPTNSKPASSGSFDVSKYVDASGNPTDQSIVALTKAIKQTESGGNINAKGASGENGAYQWMPGNFEATATKFGLDPNDKSNANQNKVAYLSIAQMKDAGLHPWEVASKWNSGQPQNWQNHSGVNSQGVHYDTPGYVSKVMNLYNQFSAPPAPAPLTADQAAGKASGAFMPANTQDPNLAEPLKVLPNMIPSAFNFVKGALDLINPVSTFGKISQTVAGVKDLNNTNSETQKTNQSTADMQNKLISQWQAKKAAGQNTSQLDNFFKAQGIDPTKYQSAPPIADTNSQIVSALPEAAYNAAVPEAGRALVSAAHGYITNNNQEIDQGLQTAQRDITNDPVGSILPFILAAEGGAKALDNAGLTDATGLAAEGGGGASGALDRTISRVGQGGIKAADIATKPIQYAFGKISDAAGAVGDFTKNAAKFAGRQLTGLNADTAAEFAKDPTLKPVNSEGLLTKRGELGGQIQDALAVKKTELGVTPESLGQEVQSSIGKRSADLTESGKGYNPIRTAETPIKVAPDFLEGIIKDTTGLDIKKTPQINTEGIKTINPEGETVNEPGGKLSTTPSSKIRNPQDIRAIQGFYDTYQPLFDKGEMTPNEFLNMRTDLAQLSKFEKEFTKSTPLEASAQLMRGKINSALRPQISGLAELDKTFSEQTAELKTLSKGLVDKNGTLSDAGLNKIAKATANKPQLLAQLEQVSPGITARIQALQQFNDLGKGLIDENGKITDSGMKKITNAANESNAKTLARLEEIKPGITKTIQQYKALQDAVNASEKFKVGTYGRSIGQAGILGGIMTLNPALIASAVGEMILTNPENAIKIIQTYARTKPIMDGIVTTLKNGAQASLKAINESPTKLGAPSAVGAFNKRVPVPTNVE